MSERVAASGRTIVCATDFGEASERAARRAVELARALGARLEVVHVWEIPVIAALDGPVVLGPAETARVTSHLQQQLDAAVEGCREPGLEVHGRLVEGVPDREVVRLASELGADLIVVGTHGRRGLARMILGSIADRIVRTSPVPVVVVPA